ncbi:MAG: hypothetical protein Q8O38_16950 [Sulfurimicrobium sp.]|nr:hypothetical protein [Sulfurimicrobium sp.]
MAGNKYLKNNAGTPTEEASLQASAGAGDAGKIVALDAAGKIDNSMMPTGIGADTASIVTSENLAAGDLVNVYNVAGTATARKADATTAGKEAHGFVLAAVTSPAAATVYFEGSNTAVTGLTPGVQFLATTAGGATVTCPAAAGNVAQKVGIATSATNLNFEAQQHIVLA